MPVSAVNRLDAALRTDLATERSVLQTPVDAPPGPRQPLLQRLPILPPEIPLHWPPALGRHTESVLREVGLGDEQIAFYEARNQAAVPVTGIALYNGAVYAEQNDKIGHELASRS